jgi:hypothetical protein
MEGGLSRGGGGDELVEGVGEGGGSVDGVILVCFESDLAAEGPDALYSGVVGKGA